MDINIYLCQNNAFFPSVLGGRVHGKNCREIFYSHVLLRKTNGVYSDSYKLCKNETLN